MIKSPIIVHPIKTDSIREPIHRNPFDKISNVLPKAIDTIMHVRVCVYGMVKFKPIYSLGYVYEYKYSEWPTKPIQFAIETHSQSPKTTQVPILLRCPFWIGLADDESWLHHLNFKLKIASNILYLSIFLLKALFSPIALGIDMCI